MPTPSASRGGDEDEGLQSFTVDMEPFTLLSGMPEVVLGNPMTPRCRCGHGTKDHEAYGDKPCYAGRRIRKQYYQCVCRRYVRYRPRSR